MADTASDPIDHPRPAQPLGETTKDTAKTPGLVLVAVAVVAFVVCLVSFALRHIGVGVDAASITLLAAGASLAWLAMEARGARQLRREWSTAHRSAATPH